MQAYEAYYSRGRFVPLGIGKLPEGTRAIVTVPSEVPQIKERLKEFDALVADIRAAVGEDMPEIERVKFCGVEV